MTKPNSKMLQSQEHYCGEEGRGGVNEARPGAAQTLTKMFTLTKEITPWDWGPEVDKEFGDIKKRFTQHQALHPFDPDKPTRLVTDAARLHGLGFALLQMTEAAVPAMGSRKPIPEKWHMIKCGSITLLDCQRRYATCEIEALAIMWAIKKCRYFLEGLPYFEVYTDHKTVESMFKHPNP